MLLTVQIVVIPLLVVAVVSWLIWFLHSRSITDFASCLDPDDNHLEPHETPHVTVCVPARDEENNIADCLHGILNFDYPDFDVLVVDDRSTDRTPEILEDLARRHPRLKVVRNSELPEGWMGKSYALHVASQHTDSPWLFFLDADTRHHPQCLRASMRQVFDHDLDVLTAVCGFDTPTLWERIIMPICGAILMRRAGLNQTNRPDAPAGFINGQFILMSRRTYDDIGGHAAVAGHILEDLAFAHIIKNSARRVRLAWGRDVITVRMYRNLAQMLEGWSRIFLGAIGRRPAWYTEMALAVCVCTLLPSLVILLSPFLLLSGHAYPLTWINFSLASLAFAFSILTMRNINVITGVPTRYAFLRSLSSIPLIVIYWRAIALALGRASLSWRGTSYVVTEQSPFGNF